MIKKIILAILVLMLLGGGVFVYVKYVSGPNVPVSPVEEEYPLIEKPPPPVNRTTIRIPDKSAKVAYSAADLVWSVENAPDYEETMPKQNVVLTVKGKVYPVGSGVGCEIAIDGDLLPNELTRKSCWFAGAGDDFSVFKEGDAYIAKHRWTQEGGGPDVEAETEGPWEVLFTVE